MLSQRALLVVSFGVVLASACGNHNYQGGGRRHELPVLDANPGTSTAGSVTTDGQSSNGEGGAPLDEGGAGSGGTAGIGVSGTAGNGGNAGGTTGFSGGPGLQ